MTVTYTIGGGGGQPPSTTTPPTPPPPPTKLLPKYDVFLSFRGEDLRGNFIEHLYDRLSKEPGVNAFMDDKEKPKGYPLSTLLEAINRSTMSVVVFSSGFADSKWIVWRVQRKVHVALPVFFHVSTRDVGKQSGSYEAAFAVHEKNESPSKVKGWRNAMTAASRLTGWTFSGKEYVFLLLFIFISGKLSVCPLYSANLTDSPLYYRSLILPPPTLIILVIPFQLSSS
ncbi:Disease resistance protein RPV1 [Linum perenne]